MDAPHALGHPSPAAPAVRGLPTTDCDLEILGLHRDASLLDHIVL